MYIALLGTVVSFGSYFYVYRLLKNMLMYSLKIKSEHQFRPSHISVITFLSGVASCLVSNPFWLVNTRMTLEKDNHSSMLRTIIKIYKKEGMSAFFKGFVANVILVLNPVINFVVYEQLKKLLTRRGEKNVAAWKIFAASSLGKLLATIVTYPIITIRIKQQANQDMKAYELFQKIVQKMALGDYFSGIQAKIVQTVLYNAFLLVFYEKIRAAVKFLFFFFILRTRGRRKLK